YSLQCRRRSDVSRSQRTGKVPLELEHEELRAALRLRVAAHRRERDRGPPRLPDLLRRFLRPPDYSGAASWLRHDVHGASTGSIAPKGRTACRFTGRRSHFAAHSYFWYSRDTIRNFADSIPQSDSPNALQHQFQSDAATPVERCSVRGRGSGEPG